VKTYRAVTIENCAEAARRTGLEIIAHMPRMAEFYRKRANEQLRTARAAGDQASVRDAKAKLGFLRWVDNWTSSPARSWSLDGKAAYDMANHLSMIGYSLRYLIQAYAEHADFRNEWRPDYQEDQRP
jgi:hypothetical protein